MIEHSEDRLVRDAFAQFGAEVTAEVPGPDLAAVRRIARRHRTTRRATAAALAVIAVAVPVSVYILAARAHSPSPTAPPPKPLHVPVTRNDLQDETFVVPPWGPTENPSCPSGPLTLVPDYGPDRAPIAIDGRSPSGGFVQADVDRDGDLEAIVSLTCMPYGAEYGQVIVVGRDRAGRLETLGQVVRASNIDPVRSVLDIRAEANGDVGVLVGDRLPGDGALDVAERQWRTYHYDGSRFRQVGGPLEFTPAAPATDLTITMTPLRLGPAENGARHGAATATVTNGWSAPAPGLILIVDVDGVSNVGSTSIRPPQLMDVTVRGGTECTTLPLSGSGNNGRVVVCKSPELEPGASRSFQIEVTSPVTNDDLLASGYLRAAVTVKAEQPGIRTLDDTNAGDNWTRITMTAV